MTESQHAALRRHLFPGDGYEAVAILLCGRGGDARDRDILCVRSLHPIPLADCTVRTPDRVSWRTDAMLPILQEAAKLDLGIVKIHSHPTGYERFSAQDDESDRALFPGIYGWTDSEGSHLSAVMLPNGLVFARRVLPTGKFASCRVVACVGNRIRIWANPDVGEQENPESAKEVHRRTAQAFGEATVRKLRGLRVAVVGCSGTGGWVVELLARLGVGYLVLIDPDRVEPHNLNRIVHATIADAHAKTLKVDVLSSAIQAIGLGTVVNALSVDVISPDAVRHLAQCDVIFGCVDSVDARELLNRVCTYYEVPLIDVGVRLEATGDGGIGQIVGSVHYVHPESRSFLERGLYTPSDLYAAGLRRGDPDAYADQVRQRYIRGANEDRPAVASVNSLYSSLAVNELLARIHDVRDDLSPIESITISLTQLRLLQSQECADDSAYKRWVGRGDCNPMLGIVGLDLPAGS